MIPPRPNPRLQRTRAARSPLSRQPLGRSRKARAIVWLGFVLGACHVREDKHAPVARHPEYLVVRSITPEPEPGLHHLRRVVLPGGRTAFAGDTPVLDLNSFIFADARLANDGKVGIAGVSIWIPLTAEGAHRLLEWKAQYAGETLGVFLKGKFVDVPWVKSRSLDGFSVELTDSTEATAVLNELHAGGASE